MWDRRLLTRKQRRYEIGMIGAGLAAISGLVYLIVSRVKQFVKLRGK